MANTILVTNINDSGVGSLRQAIATAQAGDTIIFDRSLTDRTIALTEGQLEIDKNLIIDGENAPGLTISGNNSSRIFDVDFQKNFTLKNLIIADGKTTEGGKEGNGGGIQTSSEVTLTVENSQFLNNVASGEGGGAIAAGHKSTTTIIESKFDGNEGFLGLNERGGGAIITNGFAALTIENSQFTNNKGINGGAINAPSTALTIESSTFFNNDTTAGAEIASSSSSPRGFGGAIYTDGVSASFGGDNGSIIIRNSQLENNKGSGAGGAAFLFVYPGDNVIIENNQIINNSVVFNQNERADGGGIRLGVGESSINRNSPGKFEIINTTFAGNMAESQGGGLWIDRKLDLTRVDIVNSTFSENKAESKDGTAGLGGAIATFAPTTITNTTIANNRAAQFSGAIYTTESEDFTPEIVASNTIFDRNTAGNEEGNKQQTNVRLIDGGGNLQFPAGDRNNIEELVAENITIGDPKLAPLQEIDGALVRPLQPGSLAIDGGNNAIAPAADQLGGERPVDGDGNGSEVTDIGAYEFNDGTVSQLNNPPAVLRNQLIALKEKATSIITKDKLQAIDADGDRITFGIKELPENGVLELNDRQLAIDDRFTQRDIDSGNLSYIHDGSETTEDAFNVSATDGNGGDIDSIDVNLEIVPVNDRPTDILLDNNEIAENSKSGTVIGKLSAIDAEVEDTHAYVLVDDAGGRFAIEGDRLLVANGNWLDFETKRSHEITVRTVDGGTPSKSLRKKLIIEVTDADEGTAGLEIRGTEKEDKLAGSANNDKLAAAGGNDIIWGGRGRDLLRGGRGHDILLGGKGKDLLEGGFGRDRLNGNSGDDTLVGGAGRDKFIFNTNKKYRPEDLGVDVIADFKPIQSDRILLDRRTFTAITSDKGRGFSVASEFEIVDRDAAAAGSDAVVVYNESNGNLFYNPNGSNNGLGSGGLFATLTDAPPLEESDFLIR